MLLIIILLLLLLIGICIYLFLQKLEIRRIRDTIYRAHEEKNNEKITVINYGKDIVGLANAINLLYNDLHSERSQYERYKRDFNKNLENISHDLRTPLTSVIGYIGLLQTEDETTQKEQQYLDIAAKRADMLKRLVENLYDLACLESHGFPFEMEAIDINAHLAGVLASYYDKFLEISEEPIIELSESPMTIFADKMAMSRIFDNLLQNIIKHGGTDIFISSNRVQNTAYILFSNRTQGLSEETALHLFERFFSGDKSRSTKGSGLGLSIVKEFVEQMGGRITADYKNGVLTFKVDWPII